ncbi:MAG: hypothetical protein IPO83_05035 [Chitinophagaceae bacterium]|nr:hypothetical protein [Chitinophagaceae bacterium]
MPEEEKKIIPPAQSAVFELPPEGSLGLLALGAVAVKPWRQKRIESGFEEQLIERCKKQVIEGERKKEERQKRIEEAKLKKEQEQHEQKNS